LLRGGSLLGVIVELDNDPDGLLYRVYGTEVSNGSLDILIDPTPLETCSLFFWSVLVIFNGGLDIPLLAVLIAVGLWSGK